ncbi:MAG: LacI family DNA-binding transcriptional regulator [Streptosporangiales bacterium]|nr:LacI family DNA-binding transcriptional regulator [Streptosporangiales bacterium]
MATIKEVAAAAGVAPSVVSRLLNGDATLRIRPETRDRIHGAVEQLRYTPNVAARSLRGARSGAIAMALHEVVNPVYAEIVAGAQAAAADHDQALFLGDVDNLAQGSGTLVRLIDGGALDGLVIQGASRPSDDVLAHLANKVPTVMLQEDPRPGIGVVALPDEQAARVATEHLVELGHTRVGCVTTMRGTRHARDRLRGWRRALQAAGIKPEPTDWLWGLWNEPESGARVMGRLLDRSPDLTAVVVCNVIAAIGALGAASDRGYEVPRDISVLAIHDLPLARFVRPALTTVQLPLAELGRQGVDLLADSTRAADASLVVSEPAPALIPRASTAPPPA